MGLVENVLGNHSLVLCGGATKVVKLDVEPLVDLVVDRVVVVADFLGGCILLECLSLEPNH